MPYRIVGRDGYDVVLVCHIAGMRREAEVDIVWQRQILNCKARSPFIPFFVLYRQFEKVVLEVC